MAPSAAQINDLITAAGKAAGLLEGLEMLIPRHAAKIEATRKELSRTTWAALGRPTPASAVGLICKENN